MPKMIFVNLPVTDLAKSRKFYEAIGATNNPHFTDDSAAAMVISDTIYVMIMTHDRWKTFTAREIPDAHKTAQVLLALTEESRADVDARVKAASDIGTPDPNPVQEHGFMYGRSFADPDGHIWEVSWMDPAVAAGEAPAQA
ncbi:MAG: VOC family protein [Mesorhizobium sp.]